MLVLKKWIAQAIEAFKQAGIDVKLINQNLAKKVDKEAGKGLSDTNFTQTEKDKLAGLSLKYLGNYVSLAALKTAYPEGSAETWPGGKTGYYADVDEGKNKDVVRYIFDSDDFKWVKQAGSSSQLTASEVKTLYESNSDTNAYTDTDKALVAGITAKADKTTKIKAGTGLTGGGDLSADMDFSIGFSVTSENIAGTTTDKAVSIAGVAEALDNWVGDSDPLVIYKTASGT